jgi:cell division protein FtsW
MAPKKVRLIPETQKRKPGFHGGSNYYDYSLVAVIVLLTCFGLIMLYSTSSYLAEVNYGDDMYYFKKQALISLVCILGALWISRYDYHVLAFLVTPLYIVSFVTMVLVKTPLGSTSHGATRWLKIGPIQFQPAEIAKIAVIVCLSYMIVQMGTRVRTLKSCMQLGVAGGLLGLIAYVCTDNLSTAIIILGITAGMIFLAHPRYRMFIIIAAVGVVAVLLVVFIISNFMENSTNFRIQRVYVWLHPEKFSDDESYQSMQALYAIGSGGFFGRGLGNSIQKLGSVPEAQNDFIFSIICEELGVLGALLVVMMFAYLLYRLFFIAQNAPDMFGSLMVSGVFIHIALQVILNIGVVVGVLPNTGVTLPFISYGGTSILFLMTEMGLALSVSKGIRLRAAEQLL